MWGGEVEAGYIQKDMTIIEYIPSPIESRKYRNFGKSFLNVSIQGAIVPGDILFYDKKMKLFQNLF